MAKKTQKKTPAPKAKAPAPVSRGRPRPEVVTPKNIEHDRAVELGIADAPDSMQRMREAIEAVEAEGWDPILGDSTFAGEDGPGPDYSVKEGRNLRDSERDELGLLVPVGDTMSSAAAKFEQVLADEEGPEDDTHSVPRGEFGRPEDHPSHTLEHAAAAFESMLSADDGGDGPEAQDKAQAQDEQDSDEADEADEGQDEPDSDAPIFTIEVDGKEVSVSREEARQGYMRQQAFTQKTQRAAEEMRTARAERDDLSLRYSQVATVAESMATVLNNLPADQKAAIQQLGREARAQLAEVRQRSEAEDMRATEARLAEEESKFLKAVGLERARAETVAELKNELVDAALDAGFTIEELGAVADHRLLLLLHRAALRGKSLTAGARKRPARAHLDPGTASDRLVSGKDKSRNRRLSTAQDRLRRTGSVRDAAAVFAQMLGD